MRSVRAITVWSWWARDAALGQHEVFVVAAPCYSELEIVLRRVGLPKPAVVSRLLPFEHGFFEAASAPGRLLWMPLEQFAARLSGWRTEAHLRAPLAVSPWLDGDRSSIRLRAPRRS